MLLQLLLTFDPVIVEKVAVLLLNMMVVSDALDTVYFRDRVTECKKSFLNKLIRNKLRLTKSINEMRFPFKGLNSTLLRVEK